MTGSPHPRTASKPFTPPININQGLQGAYSATPNHEETVPYALRAGNESDVRRSQFYDSEVNSRRQMDEMVEILEPLRFLDDVQSLVQEYTSTAQVALVPRPLMLYATSRLFDTCSSFSLQQDNGSLRIPQEFAAMILRNTTVSVAVHPDLGYEAFVDMFTGDNLRLEILGIIFTVAARSRVYRLPRIPGGGEQNDQKLYRLFKAGLACLNLAHELAPTVNDVMIWLSFEMTRLYTNAQGDAHPNVWRSMGDTISDAYIMDIHREAKVAANTPFWLAECRRKNWAGESDFIKAHALLNTVIVIYHWDKVVATFFQRPPRLSKRFSDCKLPLDLRDSELLGSPAALNEARSKLTSEGWNPEGAYCSTTWYRMRFQASTLLEDQWQYKDQQPTLENINKLKELAERCQAVRLSFPECLQYHAGIWTSGMTSSECVMLAIIYLLHLRIDLQAHTMLMRTDPSYTGTTLKIANEIVSTVNHWYVDAMFKASMILLTSTSGQVRERNLFLQHDNAYVVSLTTIYSCRAQLTDQVTLLRPTSCCDSDTSAL